jgi:predicted MPP superfamily phosphohydrolase
MRKYRWVKIVLVLVIIIVFLYANNNMLQISNVNISSPKIPTSFSGYKMVQISDLHSKSFGKGQKSIINKIKKLNPDIIVITGDIVDRRRYNETNSITFVKEAVKLAPVYYITGNHEAWSGNFESSLEDKLSNAGVKLLRNKAELIKKGEGIINLIGIDDPAFNTSGYGEGYKDSYYADKNLKKALSTVNNSNFTILLSHRPELINTYVKNKIDLVFSGHAHGGQVRLPFIGGLVAPNQGILPKYTSGKYTIDGCNMIVSRGLGNSIAPFRIFNTPNIVLLTLK